MTEIPKDRELNNLWNRGQVPVDEYHPLSVDWEIPQSKEEIGKPEVWVAPKPLKLPPLPKLPPIVHHNLPPQTGCG